MEPTSTTHFPADDGTRLAAHVGGNGDPLVCLPGGPMLDSGYFRDLGGLDAHRQLVRLDLRGTGDSAVPADPASYRCDRQVADVEALRLHLGLDRLDLLGHSAGANLAYRYAERHPDRVGRLVLVAPSTRALGIDTPDAARSEIARLREGEPWYAEAAAALARVQAGTGDEADWAAITPFMYQRWDDESRAYESWMNQRRLEQPAVAYGEDGAFDPDTTRSALAALDVPVLVLACGHDTGNPPSVTAEVAALFPSSELVVQDGAGHFPWVDDPERFVELVAPFVSSA